MEKEELTSSDDDDSCMCAPVTKNRWMHVIHTGKK